MAHDDWDLTEGLDPEGPSADDLDRFGDELIPCSECGRMVYDQTVLCPHCGGAVMQEETAGSKRWAIVVALILIAVIVFVWVL